jgi:hypothetical protein
LIASDLHDQAFCAIEALAMLFGETTRKSGGFPITMGTVAATAGVGTAARIVG